MAKFYPHQQEDPTNVPDVEKLLNMPLIVRANIDAGGLTERETQVCILISYGHSNEMIGRSLVLSTDTVKEYIQNVIKKTGLLNRTAIAAWFVAGCHKKKG